MNLRNRKTVALIWMFSLAMGLVVLPLLIRPKSIVTWWILVAKGLLLFAIAMLIAITVHWAFANILIRLSMSSLRSGHYERALRLMEKMKTLLRHEFRSSILVLAGRPEEAEEIIVRLVSGAREPGVRARRLTLLAEDLMDQGRWAEAKHALEEAIRLDIGLGSPLVALADWYLLQGIEPEQALRLIEQADTAPGFPALESAVRDRLLAFRFAPKAVALARLGRQQDAESAIAESLRMADATYVPGLALLHWHAGLAFDAMCQPAKARDHFQQAAGIDAQGKYGKLAARCLAEDTRNAATS